jgi:hypothetical protein
MNHFKNLIISGYFRLVTAEANVVFVAVHPPYNPLKAHPKTWLG